MSQHMGQLAPGTKCDRYEIVRLIGAGGMGEVYMALHEFTKKPVALKVLRVTHAAKQHHVEQMRAEAMVLCRIKHDNLVEVYDAGIAEVQTTSGVVTPLIWMAMELLDGESLRERLMREGAVRPSLALEWTAKAADGLAAAHAAQVIHRDLKPENVFLTRTGDITVLDFGTAKFEGFGEGKPAHQERVGTVPYMSPEQLGDDRVDVRSDVFALGFILYEMIAGRHPFSDQNGAFPPMDQLIGMQIAGEPDSLEAHVGGQVWAVVARAIAKDPSQRYASMAELAHAARAAALAYGTSGAVRLSGSSANVPAYGRASATGPYASQTGANTLSNQTPPPLASPPHVAPSGVTMGAMIALGATALVLGAAAVFLVGGGRADPDVAAEGPASTTAADTSTPTETAETPTADTTVAATDSAEVIASATPSASAVVASKQPRGQTGGTQPKAQPKTQPKTAPKDCGEIICPP